MFKIITLRNEAKKEAYLYFDANIKALPRTKLGEFDESSSVFHNSEIDAFRHAYTSGRYLMEFNELIADILGRVNEDINPKNPPDEKNMDLWNNSIGRKYGKIAKTKEELAKLLHKALQNGELIITPSGSRKYEGKTNFNFDPNKSVIVVEEKNTGRNEVFLDLATGIIMSREEFVGQIQAGDYPGYTVANINDIATPMSKPDGIIGNNLG